MWSLSQPTTELIRWYKSEMLPGLKERISSSDKLSEEVKSVFISAEIGDNNLIKLLTAKPQKSFILNNWLWRKINAIYDVLPAEEKELKLKEIKSNLLGVFDYENEISQKKRRSYYISQSLGTFTCPYCNRHYTITTVSGTKAASSGNMKKGSRIARPHLDHWFDKSDFPMLSLNIFNLIPCCPVCNSSIKGKTEFRLDTHIHPYLYDKPEPPFRFKRVLNPEPKGLMRFIVDIDTSDCDEKEKRMAKDLSLAEIYAYHGMLEAKDLMDWSIENTPDYINELFKGTLAKYKCSVEDAFRIFFGTEYLPTKNLDRPLSKLKRDILIQLGLLNSSGQFIK